MKEKSEKKKHKKEKKKDKKGSLADKLGFKAGDRLVTIDGSPQASVWNLKLAMRARAGRKLLVQVEREGKQEAKELSVPSSLP